MKFSVIVPVYNVEKYINICLKSLDFQSFKDFEIILVDDGSTDKSGRICEQYAKEHVGAKVIHQSNKGLSEARNTGIKEAQGEYLILLDADDFLDKNALLNLCETIGSKKPDIIVNHVDRYDEGKKIMVYSKPVLSENRLPYHDTLKAYFNLLNSKKFTFTAWIFVCRKNFIQRKKLLFESGILHEDELWTHRILVNAATILYNNNPFYVYRVARKQSIMSLPDIFKIYSLEKVIWLLKKEIKDLNKKSQLCQVTNIKISDLYLTMLYNISDYRDSEGYDLRLKFIVQNKHFLLGRKCAKNRIIYSILKMIGIEKFMGLIKLYKNCKGISCKGSRF